MCCSLEFFSSFCGTTTESVPHRRPWDLLIFSQLWIPLPMGHENGVCSLGCTLYSVQSGFSGPPPFDAFDADGAVMPVGGSGRQ
ncbi:hypothetical protein BofuT4_uP068560.1 [Botrytis cinerea T4]|uniref:Uncharacterized protein n=1 Tax=Botryotinia fuckeliana (strain T4) TaxID=999810 RepID=G2XQV3_BOTF4|nr:hypothetical protein BofuT4_uP068560.1 [Botrytis cinerea T4]